MAHFRIEVRTGQDQRQVEADTWREIDGWLIFYRKPAQGGTVEYWRIQRSDVVCMETRS